jgi:excinuclease ABC subunit A
MKQITIRGARQHNLKNIDLDLPRLKLIVITGVSGSGKSSLAFDTLYAEGQRRYMESLSTYARQFLQRLDAPQVDAIEGLSPAIAIEQKGLPQNPRSTVGTLTEIYDYLRLLYARLGTVYCPACNAPVRAYTIPQMVHEVFDWPEGSRLLILAPLGKVKEKELPKALLRLRRDGFVRVRINGKIFELDPPPALPRQPDYDTDVVVDRIILNTDKSRRLSDALELASRIGQGSVRAVRTEGGEKSFSERFRCDLCGQEMTEPTPSLFSLHHPSGACTACNGLGYSAQSLQSSVDNDDDEETSASAPPEEWSVCPECRGSRLNERARSVRLGELGIHEISHLPICDLRDWLVKLALSPTESQIASRPKQEILHRLDALEELGLPYLSLDRSVHTLSGGEGQRIRLANQISAPLSGVLYVLDEPSIGLHPRDHEKLLHILFRLRDAGNTVVVVEHDAQTILQSDYVVDIGPGAGTHGGNVVFSGTPDVLLKDSESLTGLYLSGRKSITIPRRRKPFSQGMLRLTGARGNNLKSIDVSFPLGCLICITGVSGSGKSTLVLDTLYKALSRQLYNSHASPEPFDRIDGAEAIHKIIHVDQSPLGRTPRSNPATSTGLFSLVRQLYSQIPEARARGYGANRFSFNVKGGRCEVCKGEGAQRVDMAFLPDVYVTCPACLGTRYNRETLEILFKGKSIAEMLDMTVHQAAGFFENQPLIRHKLEVMQEVGLGYLRLGQPATMLSGGEAQRVKLARELSRKTRMKALYLMDEPTTGLHFDDIEKLLHVLQKLVDAGHTVILIEHNLDVIKTADYVIDLGPEGGEAGGFVVADGTPEEVAEVDASYTGRYLRQALGITRHDRKP